MSVLKDKILITAIDLFQKKGINSTGVDAIVAKAGTTKMTLYKHYKSKEVLITAALKKTHTDFVQWLDQKLDLNSKRPEDKIELLFNFIEEWITDPAFLGMGFIKAAAEFPDEQNPVHQLSSEQSKSFRFYIAALAKEANIKDTEGLALQLSLLFEGAAQAEQMKRGSGAIQYAKKAAKLLIDNAEKA